VKPGRIFLVDFEKKKIISDEEFKSSISTAKPYTKWIKENCISLDSVALSTQPAIESKKIDNQKMVAFGYTTEDIDLILTPMAVNASEALGSMGNDASLACLSSSPQLMYDYFQQLFAQVTNPPIDPIREGIVMSVKCFIGPEGNMLDCEPEQCKRVELEHPILTPTDLEKLKHVPGWKVSSIDITFNYNDGTLEGSLTRICDEASRAVDDGSHVILLSDRETSKEKVPVPSLLAAGAVHHTLVSQAKRLKVNTNSIFSLFLNVI